MTGRWSRIVSTVAVAALVAPTALAEGAEPTLDALRNAAYSGFEGIAGSVTLTDGQWQGEPFVAGGESRPSVTFVEGFVLRADLYGDGVPEALVLLVQGMGGSGEFVHLAVVAQRPDGLENVATALLGDRVEIREGRVEDRRILLDVLRPGAEDDECCPGELATLGYAFQGGRLEPFDTGVAPTRLSLETLAGTEYVLESWAWNEPAPAAPEVTLRYEGGRLAGHAGCNRYSAPARDVDDLPGDVEVGPAAGTRMACPEAEMAVETRFLRQLERVSRMGFTAGRLVLSYEIPGRLPEVMVFVGR